MELRLAIAIVVATVLVVGTVVTLVVLWRLNLIFVTRPARDTSSGKVEPYDGYHRARAPAHPAVLATPANADPAPPDPPAPAKRAELDASAAAALRAWLDAPAADLPALYGDGAPPAPAQVVLTDALPCRVVEIAAPFRAVAARHDTVATVTDHAVTVHRPGRPDERVDGPHGFGRSVLVTDDQLVVLGPHAWSVHRLAPGLPEVARHADRDTGLLLAADPDDTLWLADLQARRLRLATEGPDGQWTVQTLRDDLLVLDTQYRPRTDHLWLATDRGVQHWSRQPDTGVWAPNGTWWPDHEWAALEAFTPDSGAYAQQQLLALGEPHRGRVRIVTAQNPNHVVARLEQHDGDDRDGLFGHTLVWWGGLLWVAAPNQCAGRGCVYAYRLDDAAGLAVVGMWTGGHEAGAAMAATPTRLWISGTPFQMEI